jgi:hypothetical protein
MDMQCSRYGGIDLDNVSAFHLPMVTSQAIHKHNNNELLQTMWTSCSFFHEGEQTETSCTLLKHNGKHQSMSKI